MTLRGIVIITDSFDVPDLKKALNRAVLQTANLSKVVKRRRGRRKKEMSNKEGNGEREEEEEEEDGERWWMGEISEKEARLMERWRERRAEMGK